MHRESQEIQDDAWDCTLIKRMKEHGDTTINAIYEWSDRDVWDFIKDRQIEVNPLYEMGFRRVGCVLCPMATKAEKQVEMQLFPTYKAMFIKIFDMMIRLPGFKCGNGHKWQTGEDVFNWWIEADAKDIPGQLSMFEESEDA